MSVTTPETNSDVTIFYADWCPFCAKLIKNLDRTETPYELVDVEGDNTDDINAWIERRQPHHPYRPLLGRHPRDQPTSLLRAQ